MTDFRNAICRIRVFSSKFKESKGTGFFVNSTTILTCNHVLAVLEDVNKINLSVYEKPEQTDYARIVSQSVEFDLAILEVEKDDFTAPMSLNLVSSFLCDGLKLKSFGYPAPVNSQERTTGVNIDATINSINRAFSAEVKHDLVFNFSSGSQVDHAGISGAPIFNSKHEVVGVFKRQDSQTFGGISINRAEQFLKDNNIEFKPDSLHCFSSYAEGMFAQFEDTKHYCENYAEELVKEVNPQLILKAVKGELFYPERKDNLDGIIKFLKQSVNVDEQLWKGWLELLTFVKILKGKYNEVNHIRIPLTRTEIQKKFGLFPAEKTIDISIAIDFYFTEKDTYSSIVRKFIHKELNKDSLGTNICHVFNSNQEYFGAKPINASDVIIDITNPENSGPNICGAYVGVLSLKQLRDKVIESNSLEDITTKLKQLIENAII